LSKQILGSLSFKYKYTQYGNGKCVAEEVLPSSTSFITEKYSYVENPFRNISDVLSFISSTPLPNSLPVKGNTYNTIPGIIKTDYPAVNPFTNAIEYVMGNKLSSLDLTKVTGENVKLAFELSKSLNSFSLVSGLSGASVSKIPKKSIYASGYFDSDIQKLTPTAAFDYFNLTDSYVFENDTKKAVYSRNYHRVKRFASFMGVSNTQLIEFARDPTYSSTSLAKELNHKSAAVSLNVNDTNHEYSFDCLLVPVSLGGGALNDTLSVVATNNGSLIQAFNNIKIGMFVRSVDTPTNCILGAYVTDVVYNSGISSTTIITLSTIDGLKNLTSVTEEIAFSFSLPLPVFSSIASPWTATSIGIANPQAVAPGTDLTKIEIGASEEFSIGMMVSHPKISTGTYISNITPYAAGINPQVNASITLSKPTTEALVSGDVLTVYPAYSATANAQAIVGATSVVLDVNALVKVGMLVHNASVPLGTFVKKVTSALATTTVTLSQAIITNVILLTDKVNFSLPVGESTDETSPLPFSSAIIPLTEVRDVDIKDVLIQVLNVGGYFENVETPNLTNETEIAQFLTNNEIETPTAGNLDLYGRWTEFLALYNTTNTHSKNINVIYGALKLVAQLVAPTASPDLTIKNWLEPTITIPLPTPHLWWPASTDSDKSLILTALIMITKFPLLEGGTDNYNIMDLLFTLRTVNGETKLYEKESTGIWLEPEGHFKTNNIINTTTPALKQSKLAFSWIKTKTVDSKTRARLFMAIHLRGLPVTNLTGLNNLLSYTDNDMTSSLLLTTLAASSAIPDFYDATASGTSPMIAAAGTLLFANTGVISPSDQARAKVLIELLSIIHDIFTGTPSQSEKQSAAKLISLVIDSAGSYYDMFVDKYGPDNTADLMDIASDLSVISLYSKAFGKSNPAFALTALINQLAVHPVLSDSTNYNLFDAYENITITDTILINNYTNTLKGFLQKGFTLQNFVEELFQVIGDYKQTYLVILIVNTVVTNKNKRMTKNNYDLLISLGLTIEELAAACYAVPNIVNYQIIATPKILSYLAFDENSEPLFAV
jgi:hypothetical protein